MDASRTTTPKVREVFPGLFVVPEPYGDDRRDARKCATCGTSIGASSAATRVTDGAVVHNWDCRNIRD